MSGVITSVDRARNVFGVYYDEILHSEKENHQRHAKALEEAIKRWVALDEARTKRKRQCVLDALRRAAVDATRMALD